jgi:hypothetical protein
MDNSCYSLPENALSVIQVGFSHTNILRSIVHHACLRFPNPASVSGISSQIPSRSKSPEPNKSFPHREGAQKVFIDTSERQVSLMSGTNVWLNLLGFNDVSIHNQENLQIFTTLVMSIQWKCNYVLQLQFSYFYKVLRK